MIDHIFYLFFIVFFLLSTLGYGYLFSNIFYKNFVKLNIGYIGIIGFFFLSLISISTSFFVSHNYVHNLLLHIFGILFFLRHLLLYKNLAEIKKFFLVFLLIIIAIYLYKNHDDFPYYHLSYSLNLSENQFIVGIGNFGHGFRTSSSLFFYHSLLYLPYIEYHLFHAGYFYILLFFNFIILSKINFNFSLKNFNFTHYFLLLSFIFINVAFYRIGEHGTDRSAQILLILIFYIFFEILYFEKKDAKIYDKLNLLFIVILLAASMKAIYLLYLFMIPLVLIVKKIFFNYLVKSNYKIIAIFSFFLMNIFLVNYLSTGCLIYPASSTCFLTQDWSIPIDEVKRLAIHYEWWSKAGGGPGYKSEITSSEYIANFVWLENWISRHFFNKVSDTLFGIIFISILVFVVFKFFSHSKSMNKKFKHNSLIIYIIPIFFLIEWFLNHPAMRYGGYILIALPFFIFVSLKLEELNIPKKKIFKNTLFLIIITLVVFNIRNVVRLNKEINFYNYNIFKTPFFFVEEVNSSEIYNDDKFILYSPVNKMCWASKTPCSYKKDLKVKNFLWMKMVYR
tara:strand:+ start:750 stop:2441 length:1692 start_codon:yes stop_codon:yes gene_type:complete